MKKNKTKKAITKHLSLYSLIQDYRNFKKTKKQLEEIYEDVNFVNVLESMFMCEFRTDKVGRLYTIINPSVVAQNPDASLIIYEYQGKEMAAEFMEYYVYKVMRLINTTLMNLVLFDMIHPRLEKLDNNNYLLIIESYHFSIFEETKRKIFKKLIPKYIIITILLIISFIIGILL